MRVRITTLFAITAGLALGLAASSVLTLTTASDSVDAARKTMAENMDMAQRLSAIFESAATVAGESVVAIKAVKGGSTTAKPFNPFGNSWEGESPSGPAPIQRGRPQQGQGSGFIVDADGYVLTNNHVVAGATKLRVELGDGRSFEAKLIGTDKATDLAVIKIKDKVADLPISKLGDSDSLRTGQWVLALGNPFGLAQSVSAGIISAQGRSIGMADYENWIQTDAPTNPGNSGGPLVNLRGEVIGINTAIYSRNGGGSVGIGFAIPINVAKGAFSDLKQGKKVTRGYLGVSITDLTPARAKMFKYEGTDGVLVRAVTPGSPAHRGGLKSQDIIISIDDHMVKSVAKLRSRIASSKPGVEVNVAIWRNGAKVTLTVELGDLNSITASTGDGQPDWVGVRVKTFTAAMAKAMGKPTVRGALVMSVVPGSPAAKSVPKGSVVVAINRKAIKTAEEYDAAVRRVDPEKGVALHLFNPRNGRTTLVTVRKAPE
jgi:serine protease Do